ncbi:two-component system sensor histidine kinase RppB [Leptolyngbya sp. FACHB-261]|uniref:two-component system sensor histidine kinase RppB n=1 Tax=Leptolyngbya sp. FACHB-261 TaxID=2692806 RepID=UPI0016846C36|nr:two-component system sensor histidine kinase RppB [Leptolyngbya sp. FACHB-261]MBD2103064.1 HAMP domain-containing histidine kinase [Leptolyngbya sp. FACHB-261]
MTLDKLFRSTRLRLAGWYAGVMGATVLTGGLLFYHCLALVETWWFDQTVEDLAGTFHDYLQPKLGQPGQIQPEILNVLSAAGVHQTNLMGVTRQQNYYIRLADPSGQILAQSHFQPSGLPTTPLKQQRWRTLTATDGSRYRQIDDYLHNPNGQVWGYVQLGRSMAEFDAHRQQLQIILFLSIPGAMLLVGVSGWWLAGLAMRPIYRSYQQMEQFTDDAAHELRTPLAATRALVQTAISKAYAGKEISLETLEAIERQNNRINQLVADLLLLSRTDTTVGLTATQPCCLNDLIADLQEELAPLAQSAAVELNIDVANTSPAYVLGNEEQLYRLFTNLITNGIQYTPAGGRVTVHLKQIHSSVLVQVEDTGIGIPAEAQTHIFNRLYRVDAARSRHTGGAGLGLAISLAIAQMHRGRIEVQSQLGQGSRFTVTLPRLEAASS